jgi:serine phosphatase RsbU (regulator of sigma subunit)/anti-sigma regulatory factor (Ser/Thr protein kinase)
MHFRGEPERLVPLANLPATSGPDGGHLEVLQSITDSTLGYMSLEAMLTEVLERVRNGLAADTAAVLLLDEDRGVLVARAARGLEDEVREGVQVPLARGFAGRVAAQARPMIIDDLSEADVVNPILKQRGVSSMVGVPIHVEGRVIGVMHVGTLNRRAFGEQDVALLQLAADRVALAIDTARLGEQRAATEIVQRTLLPSRLPEIPGLRFSAKYLPAGPAIKIGGDWYDVFERGGGRIVCVIGDVVGRGVLAASVMAEVRTALRAYATEGHELAAVMSLLNELLVSMGRKRSATALILELDQSSGELEAVSAGHPPAVLVPPDGPPTLLEPAQGMLLGVRRGASYTSIRLPFPTGSVLLLYTDGLIERRGEALDAGLERLLAAARAATESQETSFANRVYRTLLGSTSLDDDVALLAIEAQPFDPRMELRLDANIDVLGRLRRTLERWLSIEGVTGEDVFDLTLATSEAAANAIEHAYGAHDATFTVSYERRESTVEVVVQDTGRWRAERDDARGRGLSVMKSLVDSVDIQSDQEGTTVRLTKRVEVDGSDRI